MLNFDAGVCPCSHSAPHAKLNLHCCCYAMEPPTRHALHTTRRMTPTLATDMQPPCNPNEAGTNCKPSPLQCHQQALEHHILTLTHMHLLALALQLLIAGDIESNPGPPTCQLPGKASNLLRVLSGPAPAPILQDDAAKRALEYISNHVLTTHHPASPIFKHAMHLVTQGLGPIDTAQLESLLHRDVPYVQPDQCFKTHCRDYFQQLFGQDPLLTNHPAVSQATGDGSCGIHSINICLTGGEQTGQYALRLRSALYMAIHADNILLRSAHHSEIACFAEDMPRYVQNAFQPKGWLSKLNLAALAGTLNCPIISLHPGVHGPSTTNLLIRPLGVSEVSYADKNPILLFDTYLGDPHHLHARSGSFLMNHYCPGFLRENADYRTLLGSERMAIKELFRNPTAQLASSPPQLTPAQRKMAEAIATAVIDTCRGQAKPAASSPSPPPTCTKRKRSGQTTPCATQSSTSPHRTQPTTHKRRQPSRQTKSTSPQVKRKVDPKAAAATPLLAGTPAKPKGKSPHQYSGQKRTRPTGNQRHKVRGKSQHRTKIQKTTDVLGAQATQVGEDTPHEVPGQAPSPPTAAQASPQRPEPTFRKKSLAPPTRNRGQQHNDIANRHGPAKQTISPQKRITHYFCTQQPSTILPPPHAPPPEQPPSTEEWEGLANHLLAEFNCNTRPMTKKRARPPKPTLFTILEKNMMGGSSTTEDLIRKVHAQTPDCLILPECKLKQAQRRSNYLQRALGKTYHFVHSLLPGPQKIRTKKDIYRPGAAGVSIGIKRTHLTHNSFAIVPIEDSSLEGYMAHIRLQPPQGRRLEIIGVYMPCSATTHGDGERLEATTNDIEGKPHNPVTKIRQTIYSHLHAANQRCAKENTTLLWGGDLNASLHPTDRSTCTLYPADQKHKEFVKRNSMVPLTGWAVNRQPTFQQHKAIDPTSSRIDDMYICLNTLPARQPTPQLAPTPPQTDTAGQTQAATPGYTRQTWPPCPHHIEPCGEEGDHPTLPIPV